MSKYPKDLQQLIALLKKFPGVGSRTAERFAFHLLTWPEEEQKLFAAALSNIKEIIKCPFCGALMEESCSYCLSETRSKEIVCVVGSAKDIFSIEDTRTFQGRYYVLKCLLSPMEGRNVEELDLPHFYEFLQKVKAKEVLLALDATLEADATALYLKKQLDHWGIAVSRLAFGLPLGSSLEYVDGGTLARALIGRQNFSH